MEFISSVIKKQRPFLKYFEEKRACFEALQQ